MTPQIQYSRTSGNIVLAGSAKHFWDGLERLDEQLEKLGIGDEEVDNA